MILPGNTQKVYMVIVRKQLNLNGKISLLTFIQKKANSQYKLLDFKLLDIQICLYYFNNELKDYI